MEFGLSVASGSQSNCGPTENKEENTGIRNDVGRIGKKLGLFIENFLNTTSAHGFKMAKKVGVHFIERVLWTVCIGVALFATFSLSQRIWTRFLTSPTVISINRNKLFWNTSFPTVTVCPHNKIDDAKLKSYMTNNSWRFPTINDERDFEVFIKKLGNVSFESFDELPMNQTFGIASEDYMELLWNLTWSFNPDITSGTSYKLSIVDTITELGICYSVNSKIAAYNSFKAWKDNIWSHIPANETVVVHPLDGEIYANIINLSTSYSVYFHGAMEVPDISKQRYTFGASDYSTVELLALEILTSADARNLKVFQRRCRFTEEADELETSAVYSYNICRMQCRQKLALAKCKCIPHFYRNRAKNGRRFPVCDFEGMKCLFRLKDDLISLHFTEGEQNKCKCDRNCDDSNFFVQDFRSRMWFLGANLQWGINDYPKMKLRRDVLFRFEDLLVYIGGTAGLFLGCSLLSLTEFIYFFTWRFVKFLCTKNWNELH